MERKRVNLHSLALIGLITAATCSAKEKLVPEVAATSTPTAISTLEPKKTPTPEVPTPTPRPTATTTSEPTPTPTKPPPTPTPQFGEMGQDQVKTGIENYAAAEWDELEPLPREELPGVLRNSLSEGVDIVFVGEGERGSGRQIIPAFKYADEDISGLGVRDVEVAQGVEIPIIVGSLARWQQPPENALFDQARSNDREDLYAVVFLSDGSEVVARIVVDEGTVSQFTTGVNFINLNTGAQVEFAGAASDDPRFRERGAVWNSDLLREAFKDGDAVIVVMDASLKDSDGVLIARWIMGVRLDGREALTEEIGVDFPFPKEL